MDTALKQAARVVAVLSLNYLQSTVTPSEWAFAFSEDPQGRRRKLVPILVQKVDVDGLLGQIVYIDLVGKDENAARAEILSKLKDGRGKPSRKPEFPAHKKEVAFPGAESVSQVEKPVTFEIVLSGTLREANKPRVEAIVHHLRALLDDPSLTLVEVRDGSIVLRLQCTRRGFEHLGALRLSGRLDRIGEFTIKDVRTLPEGESAKESQPKGTIGFLGGALERQAESAIPEPEAMPKIANEFFLTEREYEVLLHISTGMTNKEVAERMNISPNTVEVFLRLIMTKMGVTNRAGIVRKVLEVREMPVQLTAALRALERRAEPAIPKAEVMAEIANEFDLTERECEVLLHISTGLTTKEVAERMNISPNTVKAFLRLLMTKMGVTTRAGMVGKVLEHRGMPVQLPSTGALGALERRDEPANPEPEAIRQILDDLGLTEREYEVLLHISTGLTTKEVAERMNISPNTVKAYLRLMIKKVVPRKGDFLSRVLESAGLTERT